MACSVCGDPECHCETQRKAAAKWKFWAQVGEALKAKIRPPIGRTTVFILPNGGHIKVGCTVGKVLLDQAAEIKQLQQLLEHTLATNRYVYYCY